jgi:hypothetical protein
VGVVLSEDFDFAYSDKPPRSPVDDVVDEVRSTNRVLDKVVGELRDVQVQSATQHDVIIDRLDSILVRAERIASAAQVIQGAAIGILMVLAVRLFK